MCKLKKTLAVFVIFLLVSMQIPVVAFAETFIDSGYAGLLEKTRGHKENEVEAGNDSTDDPEKGIRMDHEDEDGNAARNDAEDRKDAEEGSIDPITNDEGQRETDGLEDTDGRNDADKTDEAVASDKADEADTATDQPENGETDALLDETMLLEPMTAMASSDGFRYGSGNENDPYLIGSLEELLYMREEQNNGKFGWIYYALTADIDLTEYLDEHGGSEGWIPIGKNGPPTGGINTGYNFYGHLDGRGHVISGLWINSNEQYLGFFGMVNNNSTVKNLGIVLDDRGITYTGNSTSNVGGFAGYANCPVENCFVVGSVTAGSLIARVGVFTGMLGSSARLSDCFSQGRLDTTSNLNGGGFVGYNSGGRIANCYAQVEIPGNGGGFVGTNSEGNISDCYSASTSTNTLSYVFVQLIVNDNKIENCYYDQDVHRGRNVYNPSGFSGKTTSEMLSPNFLRDLNSSGDSFTTSPAALAVCGHGAGSYPILQASLNTGGIFSDLAIEGAVSAGVWSEGETPFNNGDGTADDPYIIRTPGQLAHIRSHSHEENCYTLENSIALTGRSQWKPVDLNNGGTFNGNGYTVSNLTITNSGTFTGNENIGLFGTIDGVVIENLHVEGCIQLPAGSLQNLSVGLIAGSAGSGSLIRNSFTSGSITLDGSGAMYLGGIVGQADKAQLERVASVASVSSDSPSAVLGGIAGRLAASGGEALTEGWASGSVSANEYAVQAAVAGEVQDVLIQNVYFDRESTGQSQICGQFSGSSYPGEEAALSTEQMTEADSLEIGGDMEGLAVSHWHKPLTTEQYAYYPLPSGFESNRSTIQAAGTKRRDVNISDVAAAPVIYGSNLAETPISGTALWNGRSVKGGFRWTASGADTLLPAVGSKNYTVQFEPSYELYKQPSQNDVSVTVLPREIVHNLTAASKQYDRTVTAEITGGITNSVANDDIHLNLNGVFAESYAGNGIAVNVTWSLEGADQDNYTLPSAPVLSADIYPLPLILSADDKSAYTGENLPQFTYTVEGILDGETEDEAIAEKPQLSSDANMRTAGEYNIVISGGRAGRNYTFGQLIGGKLTVTRSSSGGSSSGGSSVFSITFQSNGGTAITGQSVNRGGKVKAPGEPSREGYTFTGWYTDASCTIKYDFESLVYSSLTLYAGWEVGSETDPSPEPNRPNDNNYLEKPYINGYEDGTFQPDRPISRGEVMQILYTLFGDAGQASFAALGEFSDMDSAHWAATATAWGIEKTYLQGYLDRTIKPEQTITRAELAAILNRVDQEYRFSSSLEQAQVITNFSDLAEHWAAEDITTLANCGVAIGYEDGNFYPENPVTRAETVAMVSRLLSRSRQFEQDRSFTDVPSGHWAYYNIMNAANGLRD